MLSGRALSCLRVLATTFDSFPRLTEVELCFTYEAVLGGIEGGAYLRLIGNWRVSTRIMDGYDRYLGDSPDIDFLRFKRDGSNSTQLLLQGTTVSFVTDVDTTEDFDDSQLDELDPDLRGIISMLKSGGWTTDKWVDALEIPHTNAATTTPSQLNVKVWRSDLDDMEHLVEYLHDAVYNPYSQRP